MQNGLEVTYRRLGRHKTTWVMRFFLGSDRENAIAAIGEGRKMNSEIIETREVSR